MEGVAARLGRSSTRYGPAAVFSGPVRRWNKNWVPLSGPEHHRRRNNGANPHLLLYRWTPVSSAADGGATTATPSKDSATPPPEELPRRKFRYIPVTLVSSPPLFDWVSNSSAEVFCESRVDEAPYKDRAPSEEGSGTDLDLSLGLRAPEGDHEKELKTSKHGEGHGKSERAIKAEARNKLKRKVVTPDLEMRV
ncbi:hypothetical protein BHE74_00047221 [Ensete ventricosum]|nr:hypothetical protein BHE74_00047221 [Ensete ventricosum]